jgi:hypothetical protein
MRFDRERAKPIERASEARILVNAPGKKRSISVGLLVAFLAHLVTLALRHAPALLGICLLLSLVYVAYLAIRTAVRIQRPDEVADVDLLLCRWSWLFILGPITVFLTAAYTMEARGLNPNRLIFGYDAGWLLFQTLMEAGLVFSVAALFSPPTVAISRPRLLWKLLAVPMSLAPAFYVAGSLTRGFGQAL